MPGGAFDQRGYTGQPLYPTRSVFLWSYYPALARSRHAALAGGLYRKLLDEWRRARGYGKLTRHPVTASRAVRTQLLREVERRIVERDDDDTFTLLAV